MNVDEVQICPYAADKTIAESFSRLNETQTNSSKRVTLTRMQAEHREAKRRHDEADDDLTRNALLEKVNQVHTDINDTIAARCKQCFSVTNAQDLYELLEKQNTQCQEAISNLEDIGKQLRSQLRQKDHEYVAALKRNRKEVELLQACIEHEHGVLRNAFERELELIEQSLNTNKAKIEQQKKDELDSLVIERNNVEMQSLPNQLRFINKQLLDIAATETDGEENTQALKDKLEPELRKLEIELESAKAHHEFESDKLEFDIRVLDELSDNMAKMKNQKRRIMKGKEELNQSIEVRRNGQKRDCKENQKLEDDCERIERQSNGLKQKFERFKTSHNEKFRAISASYRDDLQQLQTDLSKTQGFIFGSEIIGCL